MKAAPHNPPLEPSLLELFRMEAETHSRQLELGLVRAEAEPALAGIEPLMRAAHSLKGAARIVGLEGGVVLAHAMEDLLSAAGRGELKLSAAQVDLLLRGNDLFKRLAQTAPAVIPAQLEREAALIAELASSLRDSLQSDPAAPPSAPARPALAAAQEQATEGFVRVRAASLNRLMALAGECLVQTKSLPALVAAWHQIQRHQQSLQDALTSQPPERGAAEEPRRLLPATRSQAQELHRLIMQQIEQLTQYAQRMAYLSDHLYHEVIASRMLPFGDGTLGFPRLVRDLAREQGKQVQLKIEGAHTPVDRDILEMLEAPLTHLLRNAVDHGLESAAERAQANKPRQGTITLSAQHSAGGLQIRVQDDGRGIDPQELRRQVVAKGYLVPEMAGQLTEAELQSFLFLPGFSTAGQVSEVSGRGVGLDVVQNMIQRVGGSLHLEAPPGAGATFHLQLPLTLSVLRALVVEIDGEYYALPLARVERLGPADTIQTRAGRSSCQLDNAPLEVVAARDLLQLPSRTVPIQQALAVLGDRQQRFGLVVDRLLGQRELVVLPLDKRLGKIPNIAASAILDDGSPLLILDVDDLLRSFKHRLTQAAAPQPSSAASRAAARRSILVVDDSPTVREMARQLLESHGYAVTLAVDGLDGWNGLQLSPVDLVLTDVDMPRLNGLELIRRIRRAPQFSHLPVMVVSYKDRAADRQAGLAAGANCYLSKSSFQDGTMLPLIRDLLQES